MFRPVQQHVPYKVAVKAKEKIINDLIKNSNVVSISPEIDEITRSAFINVGVLNNSVNIPSEITYTDEAGTNYNVQIKKEVTGRIVAVNVNKPT